MAVTGLKINCNNYSWMNWIMGKTVNFISSSLVALNILFFKILFILFLEREEGRKEGREKGRERNLKCWLPLARPLLGT